MFLAVLCLAPSYLFSVLYANLPELPCCLVFVWVWLIGKGRNWLTSRMEKWEEMIQRFISTPYFASPKSWTFTSPVPYLSHWHHDSGRSYTSLWLVHWEALCFNRLWWHCFHQFPLGCWLLFWAVGVLESQFVLLMFEPCSFTVSGPFIKSVYSNYLRKLCFLSELWQLHFVWP